MIIFGSSIGYRLSCDHRSTISILTTEWLTFRGRIWTEQQPTSEIAKAKDNTSRFHVFSLLNIQKKYQQIGLWHGLVSFFHIQSGFGMVESIVAISHGYRGSPEKTTGTTFLGLVGQVADGSSRFKKRIFLAYVVETPVYVYIHRYISIYRYYHVYIYIYYTYNIYIYIFVFCIREKTDITIATIFSNIKVIQDQHLPCQKQPKTAFPLGPYKKKPTDWRWKLAIHRTWLVWKKRDNRLHLLLKGCMV